MVKRVAIIGAGPSGLTAAKACIEYNMQPTIFEAASGIGGVWNSSSGAVWPEMEANLSKWQYFSDHSFPEQTPDFPTASSILNYFQSYAAAYNVLDGLRLDTRLTNLSTDGDRIRVETNFKAASYRDEFDAVLCAPGIFSVPKIPDFLQGEDVIHSAQYRRAPDWAGKHVTIIGGSFSSIEIAADLADQGCEVMIFMPRPVWIWGRYIDGVPYDLVTNMRRPRSTDPVEANLNAAKFSEKTFGNPGDINESLRMPIDGSPIHVVISDKFLPFIRNGAIKPVIGRVTGRRANSLITDDGKEHPVKGPIIMGTGFETDLSFLPRPFQRLLQYDPHNQFMPFVADQAVRPVNIPNLYIVGNYRGPYPAVMELQARWAASEIAEGRPPATDADIGDQIALREERPRRQFPKRYVESADRLAKILGVLPESGNDSLLDRAIKEGAVTSAQFRQSGPHAKPELARPAILSAFARATL